MITVIRETATLAFGADALEPLGIECSNATGISITVSATRQTDAEGALDVTKDRMVYTCASAPVDATLDAAIAAYPTFAPGAVGTFAVLANTEIVLLEEPLAVGESVVVDIDLHVIWRNGAGMKAEYARGVALGYRLPAGGSVDASGPDLVDAGDIQGFRISAEGTASTLKVTMKMQRAGDLTVVANDVSVYSRGVSP